VKKGQGKAQQIRGAKRRKKINNMKANRNILSIKANPGEKYISSILGVLNEE
jgi:hypothetical protein